MNKERLRQYRAIVGEIAGLEAERESLRAGLNRPAGEGRPPGKGALSDPTGQAGVRLAALGELLDERLAQLYALRYEIEEAIEGLAAGDRLLLRLRYMEGLTWPEVTERIYGGRSNFEAHFESYLRHTTRRHGHILQRLGG